MQIWISPIETTWKYKFTTEVFLTPSAQIDEVERLVSVCGYILKVAEGFYWFLMLRGYLLLSGCIHQTVCFSSEGPVRNGSVKYF
jgi:hypothetical protein